MEEFMREARRMRGIIQQQREREREKEREKERQRSLQEEDAGEPEETEWQPLDMRALLDEQDDEERVAVPQRPVQPVVRHEPDPLEQACRAETGEGLLDLEARRVSERMRSRGLERSLRACVPLMLRGASRTKDAPGWVQDYLAWRTAVRGLWAPYEELGIREAMEARRRDQDELLALVDKDPSARALCREADRARKQSESYLEYMRDYRRRDDVMDRNREASRRRMALKRKRDREALAASNVPSGNGDMERPGALAEPEAVRRLPQMDGEQGAHLPAPEHEGPRGVR